MVMILVLTVAMFVIAAVATSANIRLHAWNRRALAELASERGQALIND
jgi:hypothetical protein